MMLIVMGCDTDTLHKMNVDPQAVNEIDMNYLFSEELLGISNSGSAGDNRYLEWRTDVLFCAPAIQQLAVSGGGQYAAGDKYFDNQEVYHAPWRFWYTDVLKNATEVIKELSDGGFAAGTKVNTLQASRIIQAYTYARLTDFYGNIPYTEANQGIEGTFFPKYDKQSDIYPQILAELDDAASKISSSNADEGFSTADLMFNGDIAKWKKFAYSLMLRYAMRVSNVDQNMAATYVSKAVAGGVMTTDDDDAIMPMADGPSQWNNQNTIARTFYPGDGGQPSYLSETLVNWLKGSNQNDTTDDDPRLMVISGGIGNWAVTGYTPIDGGTKAINQKGLPNGHDHDQLKAILGVDDFQDATTWSRINPKMLYFSAPYVVMNSAEPQFYLAEALERGIGTGISGTAEDHYKAGVMNAMKMYKVYDPSLDISDAAVNAYLAKYPYGGGGVNGNETKLEQIGWQMWAAHFFNWYEAWNYWRRTGIPALTPTDYTNNLTGGKIPRRLRYPNDEVAGNPNYQDGATLPNDLLTRVWWDGGQ
jgi:hypothetical protein